MVEGVQVTLPSYEEAVSGGGASTSAESRVQIVLSEGQHATVPEAGPSRPSYLKQQQSEMAVVHPVPPSSSSSPSPSSSTWALEHAGAAASSSSQRRPSAGSDQHNLSLDSEMDYSDGKALIRHTFYLIKISTLYWCKCLYSVSRYAIAEGGLKKNAAAFGLAQDDQRCYWPVLVSGMPLESLSTQTYPSYRSSEWSCGSLRTVPLAIPKESTEGMHMYIHAYIFLNRNSYAYMYT